MKIYRLMRPYLCDKRIHKGNHVWVPSGIADTGILLFLTPHNIETDLPAIICRLLARIGIIPDKTPYEILEVNINPVTEEINIYRKADMKPLARIQPDE